MILLYNNYETNYDFFPYIFILKGKVPMLKICAYVYRSGIRNTVWKFAGDCRWTYLWSLVGCSEQSLTLFFTFNSSWNRTIGCLIDRSRLVIPCPKSPHPANYGSVAPCSPTRERERVDNWVSPARSACRDFVVVHIAHMKISSPWI